MMVQVKQSWDAIVKTLLFWSLFAYAAGPWAAALYGYVPTANPYADMENALSIAQRTDKLVLIVFGADWCPD